MARIGTHASDPAARELGHGIPDTFSLFRGKWALSTIKDQKRREWLSTCHPHERKDFQKRSHRESLRLPQVLSHSVIFMKKGVNHPRKRNSYPE